MLLVKNYIECYLNSLRALAKITSESFSYEECNHADIGRSSTTLNSNVLRLRNSNSVC